MLKKNFIKIMVFSGILLSLITAGCGNGAGSGSNVGGTGGGNNDNGLFFNGTDIDGNNIKIEIIKSNGRAVNKPEQGDGYKITKNNKEVSRGILKTNGDSLIFTPDTGFLFNGEINNNRMYVSIVHDNNKGNFTGVMTDTDFDGKVEVFNVTAADFDSTINEIKKTPGIYIINLTGDLLNYHGTAIEGDVRITLRGTKDNKIQWKPDIDNPLFDVYDGFLILEDIKLESAQPSDDLPMLAIYGGMLAIMDNVIISGGGGGNDTIFLKGGAFIMSGGEISGSKNGVMVQENDTSLVITGGTIKGNETGIIFVGNNAFLSIMGGTIKDNDVGIFMSGSVNHVVISDGEISNNTNFGINIGGSSNATTMTGGLINNNGNDGILTGGDSKKGSVTMTGGVISNHTHSGIGFHCPGPSAFKMNGGEIKGNAAGFYLRGPESEFEITGGTIYGKNSGANSNSNGSIVLHFTGNTGVGGTTTVFESNVDSGFFSGTINAEETGLVPDSLKPESGWVNY